MGQVASNLPAQPTADMQHGITVHGRFTQLVEPAARAPISSPRLCMDINACIYFLDHFLRKEPSIHPRSFSNVSRQFLETDGEPQDKWRMKLLWNWLGMKLVKLVGILLLMSTRFRCERPKM